MAFLMIGFVDEEMFRVCEREPQSAMEKKNNPRIAKHVHEREGERESKKRGGQAE